MNTTMPRIIISFAICTILYITDAPSLINYYVSNDGAHANNFTNWENAATNLRDVLMLARDGDQIALSNGVFVVTNEYFVNYAVTIRGEYGAEQTILTASDQGFRCLQLDSHGAWLDGLTISNFAGYTDVGADGGGGVKLVRGNLDNCRVVNNRTLGVNRWGGGMLIAAAWTGTVRHCRIACNVNTNQFGGGVGVHTGAKGFIQDCEIHNNDGFNSGGVFFNGGIMDNCVVRDNNTAGNGGGVSSSANVTTNTVIRNSLFIRNIANRGGGVTKPDNGFLMVNCTVVSNYARAAVSSQGGGGLYMNDSANPLSVMNCVIFSNQTAGGITMSDVEFGADGQTNAFVNCCVGRCGLNTARQLPAHQGNITNYPMFVNPDPANPDYRLLVSSPCVNAGTNHPVLGALDLDRHTRVDRFSGMVDIGGYEYISSGAMFYVH